MSMSKAPRLASLFAGNVALQTPDPVTGFLFAIQGGVKFANDLQQPLWISRRQRGIA